MSAGTATSFVTVPACGSTGGRPFLAQSLHDGFKNKSNRFKFYPLVSSLMRLVVSGGAHCIALLRPLFSQINHIVHCHFPCVSKFVSVTGNELDTGGFGNVPKRNRRT